MELVGNKVYGPKSEPLPAAGVTFSLFAIVTFNNLTKTTKKNILPRRYAFGALLC